MRKRVTIGLILFIVGILLEEVSEIADIWIIGIFATTLASVGLVVGVNALLRMTGE